MSITTLILCAVGCSAAVDKLVTFDGAKSTTQVWHENNDPVMGGQSTATFTEGKGFGIFNGTCAIVPKLKAPGFCTAATQKKEYLNDVSAHIGGAMLLSVRTTTPEFKGFKIAFAAKNIPRTSIFGGGSFKAPFMLTSASTDFQVVSVPFNTFSYDWSGFTGGCDTKDPNGDQHHCCSSKEGPTAGPKYCPTTRFLKEIEDIEIWAEGTEGSFHLEVEWIGAGDAAPAPGPAPGPSPASTTCSMTEYCCPEAKACLTPTKTSCADDEAACGNGQVCCPLTKICVIPGKPCVTPCGPTEYCCPDAKHCLTPVSPGKFCTGAGTQGSCSSSSEVCCPLTFMCVSVGAACVAP